MSVGQGKAMGAGETSARTRWKLLLFGAESGNMGRERESGSIRPINNIEVESSTIEKRLASERTREVERGGEKQACLHTA